MRNGFTFLGEYDGHKYYTFANYDSMPMVRKDAFLIRFREYERFGISRESLQAYFGMVRKLVNEQKDIFDIAQLTGHIEYLMTLPVNTDSISYMGAPLILIDNEEADELEPMLQNQKVDLARKNEKVLGFFLTAINLLSISGKSLPTSKQILAFLENPQTKIAEAQIIELKKKLIGR